MYSTLILFSGVRELVVRVRITLVGNFAPSDDVRIEFDKLLNRRKTRLLLDCTWMGL